MGWKEINLNGYVEQIKTKINLVNQDEILKKDLLLTLILSEFEKSNLGGDLIFKGGTLLSRKYLNYHRFSEDLDFVFKGSNSIRDLPRKTREKRIRAFLNMFVPKLKEITDFLGLEFSTDRSDKRYCKVRDGKVVYTFKIYYSEEQYIKIEINFIEKVIETPKEVSVKALTDLFDSKQLLFELGLKTENFNVLSYSLEEITLEKYRAILTRNKLKMRDLFDLFLIENSLNADNLKIADKIKSSYLIEKNLTNKLSEKVNLLIGGKFFQSDEKIEELALVKYDLQKFDVFKNKIRIKLLEVCRLVLENNN